MNTKSTKLQKAGAHACDVADTLPPPAVKERSFADVAREARRQFFSPYRRHRKIWLFGGIVAVAAAAWAIVFYSERNEFAQRVERSAMKAATEMGEEAKPTLDALRIHRRLIDENLADLETRVMASTLLSNRAIKDLLAPLKEAQEVLHKDAKTDEEAEQLIRVSAEKFKLAYNQMEIRNGVLTPIPPSGKKLNFDPAKAAEEIGLFLISARTFLDSSPALPLEQRLELSVHACMASRIASSAILYAYPEILGDKAAMEEVGKFESTLKELQGHTKVFAGSLPADSKDGIMLTKFAGSEERRLKLLKALRENGGRRVQDKVREVLTDPARAQLTAADAPKP